MQKQFAERVAKVQGLKYRIGITGWCGNNVSGWGKKKSFGAPGVSELEIGLMVSGESGRAQKMMDIHSLDRILSYPRMIRVQREGGRPALDLLDSPGSAG